MERVDTVLVNPSLACLVAEVERAIHVANTPFPGERTRRIDRREVTTLVDSVWNYSMTHKSDGGWQSSCGRWTPTEDLPGQEPNCTAAVLLVWYRDVTGMHIRVLGANRRLNRKGGYRGLLPKRILMSNYFNAFWAVYPTGLVNGQTHVPILMVT